MWWVCSAWWDTWSGHVAGHPQAVFLLHQQLPFKAIPPPPASLTESSHRSAWLQPKEPLLNLTVARVCLECSWGHAGVHLKFPSLVWSLSLSLLLHFYLYSLKQLSGSQHHHPHLHYTNVSTTITSSSVLINRKNSCIPARVKVSHPKDYFLLQLFATLLAKEAKQTSFFLLMYHLKVQLHSSGKERPWRKLPFEMDSSSSRLRHRRMFAWLPEVLTAHSLA